MSHEVDAYIEIPHAYETELLCLVTKNYSFAQQGIDQEEEKVVGEMEQDSLGLEDPEFARSIISYHENFYEDLRRAARSLSMVGIITRFDHWVSRLYQRIAPTQKEDKSLLRKLSALDNKAPRCPVEVSYLAELITVRNAIVHRDSCAEWEYEGRKWKVADRYVRYGEVYLSDDDISEAVRKTIAAVTWYDENLSTVRSLAS